MGVHLPNRRDLPMSDYIILRAYCLIRFYLTNRGVYLSPLFRDYLPITWGHKLRPYNHLGALLLFGGNINVRDNKGVNMTIWGTVNREL